MRAKRAWGLQGQNFRSFSSSTDANKAEKVSLHDTADNLSEINGVRMYYKFLHTRGICEKGVALAFLLPRLLLIEVSMTQPDMSLCNEQSTGLT